MWARARMMATRQLRSLAAVGLFFGDFIPPKLAAARADCELGQRKTPPHLSPSFTCGGVFWPAPGELGIAQKGRANRCVLCHASVQPRMCMATGGATEFEFAQTVAFLAQPLGRS
jgi:hypothetical protein